jgi:hypothetical protein
MKKPEVENLVALGIERVLLTSQVPGPKDGAITQCTCTLYTEF